MRSFLGRRAAVARAGGGVAPGVARSDGSPKIINPRITHNPTQFKISNSTENIVAFSSALSSTFYVS